jgi:energy-coupling factor transporter ATP-binding protein EcfA2
MAEFKIFPEEIGIENFKSIKSITLRLKPGVNLLVGANLAGKTNILEAIHFLSRALSRRELSKIPYMPHMYYSWSPEDLFYTKDTGNPITFKVKFRVTRREDDSYHKTYITFGVKFGLRRDKSTVEPVHLEIDLGTAKWDVQGDTMRVYVNRRYLEDYIHYVEKALEGKKVEIVEAGSFKASEELQYLLKRIRERIDKGDEYIHLFTMLFEREKPVIWDLLQGMIELPIPRYFEREREFYLIQTLFRVSVIDESREERVLGRPIIPALFVWQVTNVSDFMGYTPEIEWFDPMELLLEILSLFENCVLLKHPDVSSISEPQVFGGDEQLDVRARNLPQLLYKLMAERRVGIVEEAVRKVFGELSIEPRSVANRVFFVARERDLDLPPSNIADGVIKVLAISVAVELEPFILLIDEVENSLHVKALEYVFDLLNSLEIPVVLATHSPILVDLANPERTIVVFRGSDGSTKLEYFKDPRELKSRLSELGITFSDYVLYERTRESSGVNTH